MWACVQYCVTCFVYIFCCCCVVTITAQYSYETASEDGYCKSPVEMICIWCQCIMVHVNTKAVTLAYDVIAIGHQLR